MTTWYVRRAAGATYALAAGAALQGRGGLLILACTVIAAACHILYGGTPRRRSTKG